MRRNRSGGWDRERAMYSPSEWINELKKEDGEIFSCTDCLMVGATNQQINVVCIIMIFVQFIFIYTLFSKKEGKKTKRKEWKNEGKKKVIFCCSAPAVEFIYFLGISLITRLLKRYVYIYRERERERSLLFWIYLVTHTTHSTFFFFLC